MQLDEACLVAVLGGKIGGLDAIGLMLGAEDQMVVTRNLGHGAPVKLEALARGGRYRIAGTCVVASAVGVIDTEVALDAPIEQRPYGFFAVEELLDSVCALGGVGSAWKSTVAREQQRRV